MAITVVQEAGNQVAATTSITATLGTDPTPGNLLILAFKDNDGTSTITLPSGFAWVTGSPNGVTGRQVGVAWKVAEASDTTSIAVSSTTSITKVIQVWEVSGLDTVGMTYTASGNQTSTNTRTLDSTGALAEPNNFAVALCDQANDNGGEVSVDESFTLRNTATFDLWMVADKITSATTELSPTFTWTTNRTNLGGIAVFPEADAVAVTRHYRSGGVWTDRARSVRVAGAWTPSTRHYRSGGAWS